MVGFCGPRKGMWEKGVDYELGDLRVEIWVEQHQEILVASP